MDTIERLQGDVKELYGRSDDNRNRITVIEGKLDAFSQNCARREEIETQRFNEVEKVSNMKMEMMTSEMKSLRGCIEDTNAAIKDLKKSFSPASIRDGAAKWIALFISICTSIGLVVAFMGWTKKEQSKDNAQPVYIITNAMPRR